MISIDDIFKRSRYINLSNTQEYKRNHIKSKLLLESNVYNFGDIRFLLQHWESLNENQVECFKSVINIMEKVHEQNNQMDFDYIKSYIINEITPTVRDAKQSARYLKYKTTRMKNRIGEKVKKAKDTLDTNTKSTIDNVKDIKTQSISISKSKPSSDIHEAYVQILNTLDKYNQCDRVLENTYTIQKRFNIMNMVENTNIDNNASLIALVDSICECINTYDSEFSTRFNTSLETCFYFLSRKDKNFNKSLVLEEIVNIFTSKEFTTDKLLKMKSVVESTVVFDNIDKNNIEWIYNSIPFTEVADLSKPFVKNEYDKIKEIGFILKSLDNDLTDIDIKKVFSSIRASMSNKGGEELATCIKDIESLITKLSSLYSGDNFNLLCYNEYERAKKKLNNASMDGYVAQCRYLKCLDKYGSKAKIDESGLIMDIDLFNESFDKVNKSVKDIVNSFRLSEVKRSNDIRTCVSKMFTKSADQIIDGTPNFLSWLRLSYVIGATAINPVAGGIVLVIDQFISMKLKRRDISKMITVFKNEQKNVREKYKRTVDETDKKHLREYEKYLENGIIKLEEYSNDLLSDNELDAKQSGEEYDDDKELDFLKDDEAELEATSFEKLVDRSNYFSKQYFTSNIKDYINYMNEDTIDIITDVACKYPSIISTNELYSILKEEYNNIKDSNFDNKRWIRLSCLSSNIRKLSPENEEYIVTSNENDINVFDVINGLEDLFAEYSINKSMSPKNESVSTSVKMLSNKLRKLMQKASDIDKEASRRIDSAVNMFLSGMQRAARNDNREAIIKGSILPSTSKIVKAAIIDGGVALINPAIAIILALGQFGMSKKMKAKERQIVLDEIDVEIEMSKRYLRQAEDQNDLEAQKRILRIQRNLERQRQRIKYNMKVHWKQDVPDVVSNED